ncbi:TetR/AcrR family transcriptional regulator [Eubacterium coprostanoligenes]|uniref:TetR/AcrR family transcriptional regulator n=1 Tax=Eubacterium coprostanoligenes TaxID=290054 RepID=UPI00235681A7|nr:TetR/AcrR family transcriptional regulator [Eubacterium coprostanoligenes]MCI6253897.1 TetR/AcrR family transcriptional regulator [Eubacterium coprostanoligenes]
MQTEEQHRQKKIEIMEKCFECYAEHGLTGTGVQMLADACGCSKSNLYSYFKNLDELIIESTAYCMEKVEDDYMALAPTDPADVMRYIKEIPYWKAKKHGKNTKDKTDKNSLSAGAKKADANSNNYEKSPLTGNASIFASIISAGAGLIILVATRKRKDR